MPRWSFSGTAVARFAEALALEHGSSAPSNVFDSVAVPKSSLQTYAQRLFDRFGCSAECFVMALHYIEQLLQNCPTMRIKRYNAHRLLLTAVVLATKVADDNFKSNAEYAAAAGVALQELNSQEAVMLELLEWRLVVHTDEYARVHAKLRQVDTVDDTSEFIRCKTRPMLLHFLHSQRSQYQCAGLGLHGTPYKTVAI